MTFKPMLAATLDDLSKLKFPLRASAKLDGLRCVMRGGALSRSLKPFRNAHVQATLAYLADRNLDGELIVGPPNVGHVLGRTQSGIMASEGKPNFTYYLFDSFTEPDRTFDERREFLYKFESAHVKVIPQALIRTVDELNHYESNCISNGYEGVILRDPMAKYKFGRATPGENSMWKLKRFVDGEAYVMSVIEGASNQNEQTRDLMGQSERATKKEFMVPNGQVGTLVCHDIKTEEIYSVSPGRMTVPLRKYYFEKQSKLIGKIIKHKSFDYGTLNTARFRTFQAFRDADDL